MHMRILTVDDSDAMLGFLRGLMHELHHDTCESSSGFDVVDRYRKIHPNMVLMDIRPRMAGIEATERIRSIESRAQVAIVTEVDGKIFHDSAVNAGAVRCFLRDNLLPMIAHAGGQGGQDT
jgi:CheY-like chemotaxis protein